MPTTAVAISFRAAGPTAAHLPAGGEPVIGPSRKVSMVALG